MSQLFTKSQMLTGGPHFFQVEKLFVVIETFLNPQN